MAKAAKKEKVEQNLTDIAEQTVDELFSKLGISEKPVVHASEDEVNIEVETQEGGVIIGYHGEVLESLQLILSMMISKKAGKYVRAVLEVGDYRKKRMEWLERLAASAKERALAEQGEVVLADLRPWERRVIHLFLESDTQVESVSQGEGRERALVIRPRS